LNKEIKNDIQFRINNHINFYSNENLIGHKHFLNERRNKKN